MAENPSSAEQVRAASDPTTPRATLADLAYDHPDLRAAVALNPSTYPGLLEWLGELDDEDVNAALAQRAGEPSAPTVAETLTAVEPAPVVEPAASAAPAASAETAAAAKPRLSRSLRISLIAATAVVVVAALVLGGVYAFASFAHSNGALSASGALSADGAPIAASDYRFGATKTWQTKVDVVPQSSDGFATYEASVQSYPGLWLVTWPGDDSGDSALNNETTVGLDPATGSVKWSIASGLHSCAASLASGALPCVDNQTAVLSVLDPSTGKPTSSPLNGSSAESASSFKGDIVLSSEASASDGTVEDTMERVKLDGTVVWKKSSTCAGSVDADDMVFETAGQLDYLARSLAKVTQDDAFMFGTCLTGTINLDSGAIDPTAIIGDDGCLQYAPFDDSDGIIAYGDPCESEKYPLLFPHGSSTLAAVTMKAYMNDSADFDGTSFPSVWSASLPDAEFVETNTSKLGYADLGSYALLTSAGHLYGIDSADGPSWEQPDSLSGDGQVALLPIYPTKANSPVLALEGDHDTVVRLDPGYGASRVSVEPAKFPACPAGETPVSFTSWNEGKGATLVCQGFASTVTVFLIEDGTTYSSTDGTITPTGYSADFSGGLSVDIGLGGWAAWVRNGSTTTLHAATSGWQSGDAAVTAFPALHDTVEACPAGTTPLSLSTWNGGWLLTCGKSATTITRFVYVEGSTRGSGNAMKEKGGQSCGTSTSGREVCVSASPAVVAFSTKGGTPTQHSVEANYVAGEGFSGAGKGTGAYGLADPKADADSEVAYLNGILQQSQAARSSVKIVVQDILRCSASQSDVQSAQSVADARTTELEALNSAPVDAVPGGASLVSQLQAALQDSLTADQAYVTAAGQVANGDCASGKDTYNAQANVLSQGTSEKTTFTNAWNSQIAPAYGTPTYTQADI